MTRGGPVRSGKMMSPRRGPSLVVATFVLLVLGCKEASNGPCVHTYRDPVLTMSSVTDGTTGARLSPVLVSDVTVGDRAQPASSLLTVSFGVVARSDTIVCGVPCGFGTTEGEYRFTVSAPGYAARGITTDARYNHVQGGCPSFSEGSTFLSTSLARMP